MSPYNAFHAGSTWRIDESGLYFIVKSRFYLVIQMKIIANGTRDLCFTNEGGELRIRKIKEVTPGKIIGIPDDDIIQVEFEELLPFPYIGRFLCFEANTKMKPIIQEAIKRHGIDLKGDLYDAYLGKEYDKEMIK